MTNRGWWKSIRFLEEAWDKRNKRGANWFILLEKDCMISSSDIKGRLLKFLIREVVFESAKIEMEWEDRRQLKNKKKSFFLSKQLWARNKNKVDLSKRNMKSKDRLATLFLKINLGSSGQSADGESGGSEFESGHICLSTFSIIALPWINLMRV